jgi:hypothetical protein
MDAREGGVILALMSGCMHADRPRQVTKLLLEIFEMVRAGDLDPGHRVQGRYRVSRSDQREPGAGSLEQGAWSVERGAGPGRQGGSEPESGIGALRSRSRGWGSKARRVEAMKVNDSKTDSRNFRKFWKGRLKVG